MTIRPQRRAKAAQEKRTPCMKRPGRRAIQKNPNDGPRQPAQTFLYRERRLEVGVGGLDSSIHLTSRSRPVFLLKPGGDTRRIPQPARAGSPYPEENAEAQSIRLELGVDVDAWLPR